MKLGVASLEITLLMLFSAPRRKLIRLKRSKLPIVFTWCPQAHSHMSIGLPHLIANIMRFRVDVYLFLLPVLKVTPTTPRIEKLHSFLSLSSYYGKVNETNPVVQANLISRSSLQEVIQASDEEISTALSSLETIEIDGFRLSLAFFDCLQDFSA